MRGPERGGAVGRRRHERGQFRPVRHRNDTYAPRPPAVGRPYAFAARRPSGSSLTLSVVSVNSSPRRVSVQRNSSGTVTLMARALTAG
ncbi:hypothetical protein V2I01_15125 [Micromonospora sp. BRA006-A]|nr:hypothetical protein [Micromonospora sp. BRA006-A]